VAVCSSGPVTCVTTTVAGAVLQDRHIFGHQQAVFPDVPLRCDLVLVVRVYLDDGRSDRRAESTREQRSIVSDSASSQRSVLMPSGQLMETKVGIPEDNPTLVAWAFLPLAPPGKSLCHIWTVFRVYAFRILLSTC